ncbi:hypothetical protein C8R44DRAFT_745338 [Mycena epipterygia]|nr:hypothetical protein C8R44DRAFT_745338 [Mycena epipterygia]
MPLITLGRFCRDAPDLFGVKYDGRVRRSNAFERVRQISSSVEPEPERKVQVQQIVEPEPELCVQFGSVQVRTDILNRTLTTLDAHAQMGFLELLARLVLAGPASAMAAYYEQKEAVVVDRAGKEKTT